MTNFKKVTALLLSLLMAFSAFSVLGSAVDYDGDYAVVTESPAVVSVNVKFADSEGNELENLSKVTPGDSLKARVYLGTNYYSAGGEITLYYDAAFFDTAYTSAAATLTANTANATVSATGVGARVRKTSDGVLNAFTFTPYTTENVFKYDDTTWMFELDFTVKADATGEGSVYADASDLRTPDNDSGDVNFPYAYENDDIYDSVDLAWAEVTADFSADKVTTDNTVTFNANGGYFTNAAETEKEVSGTIGQTYSFPADPTRDGYTFLGWTLNGAPVAAGTTDFVMPLDEDVEYIAQWNEQVTIHFAETGDAAVADITADSGATWTDADKPAVTKEGYKFMGWEGEGVVDGELPDNYPTATVDNNEFTYTATWAPYVTISFDAAGGTFTDGNTGSYSGDAIYGGATWTDAVPSYDVVSYAAAGIERDGYALKGWQVNGGDTITEFPAVYPDADTTYTAVWQAKNVNIIYVVDPEAATVTDVDVATAQAVRTVSVPYGSDYQFISYSDENGEVTVWTASTDGSQYAPSSSAAIASPLVTFTGGNPDTIYLIGIIAPDSHVATFDPDGGVWEGTTETDAKQQTFAVGETVTAPGAVTKAGYDFAGWTPELGLMGEEDVTYTAVWEAKEYTVNYNNNYTADDDSVYETATFSADDGIELPQDPEREGYDFLGWFSDRAGEGDEFTTESDLPDDNTDPIEVYAKWEVQKYEITYEANGGEFVGTPTNPVEATYGDALPAEPEVTREGYTHDGWVYTDENAATYTDATMPAKDLTATAQWTINEYEISYDANGGEFVGTPTNPVSVEYGADIPAEPEVTREGYTYDGWVYTDSNAATYTDAVMPATDLDATAQWTVNQYELTVELADGAFEDGVTSPAGIYDYGAALPTMPTPVKTGYTFTGWVYTNTDTEATVDAPSTMPAYDVTATATWTVNEYEITYNFNGGTEADPDTVTVTYDTLIPAEPETERTGYTFDGWEYVDENGDDFDVTIGTTKMPASNLDATAQWTANTYVLTIVPNEGTWTADDSTANKVETKVYDEAFTPVTAADIERHNYTFDKVTLDEEGNTPFDFSYDQIIANATLTSGTTYALTVYVQWIYDGVYVRFNANGGHFGSDETATVLNVPDTLDGIVSDTYDIPADPVRDGYTFLGWTLNGADVFAGETTFEMPDARGIEYLAKWAKNVKITFDPDGATFTDANAGDYDVYAGATWTDAVPTYDVVNYAADGIEKEGYALKGWQVNDGDIITEFPAVYPDEDTTYKAVWQARSVTIIYVVDDEAATVTDVDVADESKHVKTVSVPYGSDYQLASYSNEDGAVEKWTELASGSEYAPGDSVTLDNSIVVLKSDGNPENIYFVAIVTPNVYNITFDANGGYFDGDENKTVKTVVAAEGETPDCTIPERAGYDFDDWDPAVVPATGETTYTAKWTPKDRTVSWMKDSEGDEVESTDTLPYGTELATEAPADPEKEGYDFDGWTYYKKNDDGTQGEEYTGTTVPEFDIIARPNFTAKTYQITYDANGGEFVGTPTNPVAATFGDALPAEPEVTRTGYNPDGWVYTDPSAATYTDATMPATDLDAVAQWTPKTYTVTFNAGEGSFPGDEASTTTDATYGEPIVTPAAPEAPEGHSFDKWDDGAGKTPDDYNADAGMPDNDSLTFTAAYTANEYPIKFIDQGAAIVEETATYGETFADLAPDYTPSKTGHDFKEWNTAEDGTGTKYEASLTVPVDGYTFYSVFTPKTYSVTYLDKDGNSLEGWPKPATYGDALPAEPEAPNLESEGKRFVKWEDADGNEPSDYPTVPDKPLTFQPVYEDILYTLTFKGLDDAVIKEYKDAEALKYGDTLPAAPAASEVPEVTNKVFTGNWNTAADGSGDAYDTIGTMPANDLVIYAVYESTKVKVTYKDADGNTVWESDELEIDADFPATIPDAPAVAGKTFTGWETADGKTPADFTKVGDSDITFTAQYKDIVKLVAKEGTTTMVERDGVVESYNELSGRLPDTVETSIAVDRDTYNYDNSGDFSRWFVTGLEEGMTADDFADWAEVTGGGRYELENLSNRGKIGTGTIVKVYDQMGTTDDQSDDELVETFYVVIYGDINGDGWILHSDYVAANYEDLNGEWNEDIQEDFLKIKAADLISDGVYDHSDMVELKQYDLGNKNIDQVYGKTVVI